VIQAVDGNRQDVPEGASPHGVRDPAAGIDRTQVSRAVTDVTAIDRSGAVRVLLPAVRHWQLAPDGRLDVT
jgi:hypothetical protein